MIRTTVLPLGCSAVVAGCGGPGPVDVVASPGTAATSPGPSADGCPTDPGAGPEPRSAADAWRRIEEFFSRHLAR